MSGDSGDQRGAHSCGIERWAVKTGVDPAARTVNIAPRSTSIVALSSLRAPREPTSRVPGVETTTWTLSATVTAIKEEADSDYHLALSDGRGHTMIAEAPDPACSIGSVWQPALLRARALINAACPNVGPTYRRVRVAAQLTGVGFFDRIHGQLGVARNGIELHPLLDVKLQGKC